MQIAHRIVSKSRDEVSDLTVELVELDPAIEPGLFDRPAN